MSDKKVKSLQERFPYIGPPHRKRPVATLAEKGKIALSGPSPDFLESMSELYLSKGYPHDRYGG